MADDDTQITSDDVAEFNRDTLKLTATIGRIAGTVLMVLAVVGLAAWLWVVVRQQGLFGSDGRFSFGSLQDASLSQRIDLFATSVPVLMSSALLGGVGFGIRLISELLLSRTGGSLTGVEVGEVVEVDDLDDDPVQDVETVETWSGGASNDADWTR